MSDQENTTQEQEINGQEQESRTLQSSGTNAQSSSTPPFVDNRPENALAQQLQAIANNSPQVQYTTQMQDMANNSPQAQQGAQLQDMAQNHAQQQQAPKTERSNDSSGIEQDRATTQNQTQEAPINDTAPAQKQEDPRQMTNLEDLRALQDTNGDEEDNDEEDIFFSVHVQGVVSGDQLMKRFEKQIYGKVVGSNWYLYEGTNKVAINKDQQYGTKGQTLKYTMRLNAAVYRKYRTQGTEGVGVELDENNNIVGTKEHHADFEKLAEPLKDALLDEIDRRYLAVSGKVDVENDADQKLWDLVKAEVLAQRAQILNRSEKVNQVVKQVEAGGFKITPKDYPKMMRLIQRLENMDDTALQEYATRTTGVAKSIEDMEQSLDHYLTLESKRAEGKENRTELSNQLFGTNDIYKGEGEEADRLAKAKELGFDNLEDYQKHLKDYKASFWRESVATGITLMQKYEHKLLEYQQRYSSTNDAQALGTSVENTQAEELYSQASSNRMSSSFALVSGGEMGPSQAQIERSMELRDTASRQDAAAEELVRGFAEAHPIVGDGSFDHKDFAGTSPDEAKEFILDFIADQLENVKTVKSKMQSDPDYVYTLDNLMAHMFEQEGLTQGSVQQQLIQDHIQGIKDFEFWTSIGIAIVAIGLGILSFGTGTLATAALVGGAALSVYDVSREFQKYSEESAAHDVGLLSKDPSFGWVLLALVGAGLDVAAAAKALKALKAPVESFNALAKTDPEKALAQLDNQLSEIDEVDETMKAALLERGAKEAQLQKAKTSAVKGTAALLQLNDTDLLMWAVYAIKHDKIKSVDGFFQWLLDQKIISNITRESLGTGQTNALRQTLEHAKASISLVDGSMMGNIISKTKATPERYVEVGTRFTDEDIYVMAGHGKSLNLSNQQIEDAIVNACRKNVNFDRAEVLSRMANKLEKQQESAKKVLTRANLEELASNPEAVEFVRRYNTDYPKIDIAKEIEEAGGYAQWQKLAAGRMDFAEQFLAKVGQKLPEDWYRFTPEHDIAFAEQLQKFRGSNDLSYNAKFRGGEGQLFQSTGSNDTVLKRWFGSRVTDMPESVRLLEGAKTTVDAIPGLNKLIDVVPVGQKGEDWILRGFDPRLYFT